MLTAAELREALAELEIGSLTVAERELERPLGPWLAQTETDAETAARIAGALDAELAGGETTGFRPRRVDGELCFRHRFAAVTGAKGA
jgi:hypothetical protein